MRIALVVLFLVCGVGAFAESQQQRPNPDESIRKPAQSNYGREKEERGSEQNPFFIKQLQSEVKSNAGTNKGKNVGYEMTPQDWSSMATALFTLVLTISTIALWVSTRALASLARDEFNATHRPQIIIHTFEKKYLGNGLLGATFTYVNIGTSIANIIEIETNIFLSDNLAAEDSAKMDRDGFNKVLAIGGKDIYRIKSNIPDTTAIFGDMSKSRGKPTQEIMCVGRIIYADKQGTSRETGFCRVYNGDRSCWLRVENSDYEYSY
jgi:hypothetical protein